MGELVLQTARLELRQIDADDLEPHLEHLNTPTVMARLGGQRPRAAILEKHEQSRAGFAAEGFGFMLAWERDSGALVGHCGLRRVANPLAPNCGDFEIGWLIREDRWRRGYAEEAMRAIIDWAFTTHSAPYLVALTSGSNIGSWKLMEKLGMERRKEWDFDDPFFPPEDNPTIQYSLSREQWSCNA